MKFKTNDVIAFKLSKNLIIVMGYNSLDQYRLKLADGTLIWESIDWIDRHCILAKKNSNHPQTTLFK